MKHVSAPLAAIAMLLLTLPTPAPAQSHVGGFSIATGDRAYLGVSVRDVTKNLVESKQLKVNAGAYVSDVVEDSPAEKAGILEGDVIVKFDGRTIDDRDELVRAVRKAEPGDDVAVVVDRKGVTKTLTATVDEPETPRAFALTVPGVPDVAPAHPAPFGPSFFVSGSHLGMQLQTLGRQLAEYFEVPGNRGVLVSSVEKKGAAAKAGMKAGDVIVRVNRNSVRDIDDILDEVRYAEADTVAFEVIRKGKPVTVSVGVGEARGETSDLRDLRGGVFGETPGGVRMNDAFREDFVRELKRSLEEMKRELKDNADDLRWQIMRSVRGS